MTTRWPRFATPWPPSPHFLKSHTRKTLLFSFNTWSYLSLESHHFPPHTQFISPSSRGCLGIRTGPFAPATPAPEPGPHVSHPRRRQVSDARPRHAGSAPVCASPCGRSLCPQRLASCLVAINVSPFTF